MFNYGVSKSELFLAQHKLVSLIRVINIFRILVFFSTSLGNLITFRTLRLNISCISPSSIQDKIFISSTLIAIPIVTKIAALILSFVRIKVLANNKTQSLDYWNKLWTKLYIEQIFKEILYLILITGLRFLDLYYFVKSQIKDTNRIRIIKNII